MDDSQPGAVTPIMLKNPSMSPYPGSYSQVQTSAMTADGRMYGRKKASRKNHWPREIRFTTIAKNSGSSTSGGRADQGELDRVPHGLPEPAVTDQFR